MNGRLMNGRLVCLDMDKLRGHPVLQCNTKRLCFRYRIARLTVWRPVIRVVGIGTFLWEHGKLFVEEDYERRLIIWSNRLEAGQAIGLRHSIRSCRTGIASSNFDITQQWILRQHSTYPGV